MNKLILIFIFIALSLEAHSQAPQAFNYQGVTRDLSGDPLPNQQISLLITIKKASAQSEVYKEIHNTLTNNLGLFNLKIGRGFPVFGDFKLIDWGSGSYYIQIEMDQTGGNNYELIGESELLSVPYALHSGSSNSYWQKNSEGLYTFENVSIGTESNSSLLTIQGQSRQKNDRTVVVINNISNDNLSFTGLTISAGTDENTSVGTFSTYAKNYTGVHGYGGYTMVNSAKDMSGMVIRADDRDAKIHFLIGGTDFSNEKARISSNGVLKVTRNDIYIENINSGVIMRSPNGQCWRLTVNNFGQIVTTTANCPN